MRTYVYVILDITKPYKWVYNDINFDYEPIYIGIGVGDRYKTHITTKLRKNEKNFIKFNLIKKLIINGTSPISIKIFEDIDRTEAKNIEIDLISKFGKLINGTGILTNITNGGDETCANLIGSENIHSKKVYQYNLDGSFIKEWGSLREIGNVLNCNYNTIGDCCRGKSNTACNFQWSYIYNENKPSVIKNSGVKNRKKVYQFNDNGTLIKIYNSLTDLSIELNVDKGNLTKIVNNCKLYKKHIYSYNDKIDISNIKKNITRIHKIIFNDEIFYMTNKEIMQMFNVSKYYVIDVKRGRVKTPKFILIY